MPHAASSSVAAAGGSYGPMRRSFGLWPLRRWFSARSVCKSGSKNVFWNSLFEPSQSSGHEIDHAELQDRFARLRRSLIVSAVSAVAHQPGKSPFDDPALG